MESVLLLLTVFSVSVTGQAYIQCPGLPSRKGITVECISTRLGAVKFNCSNPMPVDTVAHYSCQPYYKEMSIPNLFEAKSIRCNRQGRWARYNYFREFKCEYECGKALPSIKTAVIRGQLKTRTTWPWHALIYLKLNWVKVSEAINYRRTVVATSKRKSDSETFELDDNEGLGEPYPKDENYVLDPVKLAEIFDNDDLSREEIFDPRYRYIYICGGTLISDTMIVTAAHCMTDANGQLRAAKDFMVVLGGSSNNFYDNMDEPRSQIVPISKVFISEEFSYDEYRSDIAVVQLLHPVEINGNVLPACLPENRDDSQLFIANKKHGEAIGSMINIYKEGVSTELKSKKLQVLPNIDCVRNIQRIPSDKEFCAGSLGANICSGDSGGGLIATPNFGLRRRHTIQGIVSYARARRACENYAVFTRVYKFLPWIKSIIYANGSLPVFIPMPL